MKKEKNPFKCLFPEDNLPENHKAQVLETIKAAKMMVDFIDLITVKRFNTSLEIINTFSKTKHKNE